MKHSKFALAFLLILAQLAVSCGSGGTTTDTTPAGTADAGTTVGEPSEYTAPNVNYNGETFTFLDYDTDEFTWQAATYSDIHAEEESGEPINDAQYKRNIKVEELLNVNIETHPVGGVKRTENGAELEKLVLAGDNSVDAAFIFVSSLPSLLTQPGMLQDINAIDTLNPEASWWDQNAIDAYTLEDSLRVITGDVSIYTTFCPLLMYFNKEMVDQFHIPNLYDKVRDGTWTWDAVFEYCELVSSDLNGDSKMGVEDRYGIGLQYTSINSVLTGCDVNVTEKDADGNIAFTINTEKTAECVNVFVPFFNDSSVNCIANLYTKQYNNVFYDLHMPMFKEGRMLFLHNQLLVAFELRAMDADYGLLPMPKYNEDQDAYCTPQSGSWQTMLCIPATNERSEMTGHIFDALGFYSQQYVTPEFIDTTVHSKSLRDEDSAQMLEIILDTLVYDIGRIYDWGGVGDMLYKMTKNKSKSFASEYAKIESAMKAEYEATMESLR
ncbi:MAG: hypothetical protein E7632_05600 [Ruminococcaceae bacterium]|nr:hypothetical protein [Oscillospiraceae bacterium]